MFSLAKDIISGAGVLISEVIKKSNRSKLSKSAAAVKKNILGRVPKQLQKKSGRKISRGLLSLIAVGAGLFGIAAGVGVTRAVRQRLTKKAVLLVGDGGAKPDIGTRGFNGYLLKYTDIDSLEEAVDTFAANSFTELVIVPMTVINGYETEKIKAIVVEKREFFEKLSYAPALLTSSGDYERIAKTLIASTKDADEDTAVVYVGRGTTHHANSSYIALNERLKQLGSSNIFVGTASSYPDIDKVENDIQAAHYQNVVLCPLEMTVDEELSESISGEENSWYSRLSGDGFNCGCYMKGLCAYKGVRELVVEHTKSVM